MNVRFDDCISQDDQNFVLKQVTAACALLVQYRTKFYIPVQNAIDAMQVLQVCGNGIFLGDINHAEMRLSVAYIRNCTVAWLASLVGHEGQHAINHGKFTGTLLWIDEQMACETQMDIGRVIGFAPYESQYLAKWMSSDNKDAMMAHMESTATNKNKTSLISQGGLFILCYSLVVRIDWNNERSRFVVGTPKSWKACNNLAWILPAPWELAAVSGVGDGSDWRNCSRVNCAGVGREYAVVWVTDGEDNGGSF